MLTPSQLNCDYYATPSNHWSLFRLIINRLTFYRLNFYRLTFYRLTFYRLTFNRLTIYRQTIRSIREFKYPKINPQAR